MMITPKCCEEFILALDEKRFYDAHEVLEELWYPVRFQNSNEVKLLKGFINASVSFELLKKGRPQAAKKTWINYLKYRQLLFKITPVNLRVYYTISQHIEFTQKVIYN